MCSRLKFLTNIYGNPKFREKKNQTIVEGIKLIEKLMPHSIISEVYYEKFIPKFLCTNLTTFKIPYFQIPLSRVGIFTDNIVALIKFKETNVKNLLNITLICDNIRSPSNMALLLNAASSLNISQVILTKGCVEVWNPKVVNESVSSIYNIKIQRNLTWKEIEEYTINSFILLADIYINRILNLSNQKPKSGNLNTKSASINPILTQSKLTSDGYLFPVFKYDEIDYSKYKDIVLVIGGETEGLSEEAFTYMDKNGGCRINIPTIDSFRNLNSSVAASIILYEIRRQLLLNK